MFTEVRKKGCRRMIIDGKPVDISDRRADVETPRHPRRASATPRADGRRRRSVRSSSRKHEKAIKAGIAATLLVGDGLMQVHVVKGASKAETRAVLQGVCQRDAPLRLRRHRPEYFMFNNPESACRTCGGLGVDKLTHPGTAGSGSEAQHPRRLFRAGGVQVQPGHVGRPR